MTQNERIGQSLRAERERQGLSQAALEKIAGVSRTTIQSIERGTWQAERQGPTLRKIADALEVSIDDLRQATDPIDALLDQAYEIARREKRPVEDVIASLRNRL